MKLNASLQYLSRVHFAQKADVQGFVFVDARACATLDHLFVQEKFKMTTRFFPELWQKVMARFMHTYLGAIVYQQVRPTPQYNHGIFVDHARVYCTDGRRLAYGGNWIRHWQ